MSKRAWLAVAGSAAVVVLTVIVVVLASGGKPQPAAAPAAKLISETTTSTEPSQPTSTTTTATSTTTTTTTAKKPTTKATKTAMPAPTPHPIDIPVPPPPHPAPVPGCAPSYAGDNAPKPDVKAALLAGAGKQYWANATNPPMVEPPEGSTEPAQRAVITVPANLIMAVAWQESGWQSAIRACDGGVGTMQIMDATASWMNQRFRTGYDHKTLAGNTAIGAEYLEWLIAYFGENNFGHHYDITDPDLLTAVLVGYNAGPGAVQFADGHTVASRYATTVKALMQSQPWSP